MPATKNRCTIRAIWILNNVDSVIFSRTFPTAERRWRAAFKAENSIALNADDGDDSRRNGVPPPLPTDSELTESFSKRRKSEGSARGHGLRMADSLKGSDSWVDDPIMRHIISLNLSREEGKDDLLWPLILHVKGPYCVLLLPSVEPRHLKAYERLYKRSDCGTAIGVDPNLSSLLLDLPSITGACMVAHLIGDIIMGDIVEPEIAVNQAPSVGGLLDSLTGSIGITGISARAKPAAASVTASPASSASTMSDAPKAGSRPLDKDVLHSFISSSMPFGTLLDLNYFNFSAIKLNGFSSLDVPPADAKQPAWKPYLYRGKQRMLLTICETINAAMYDRDEIPDSISVAGLVNCRAELEGLPDVSFPLSGLNNSHIEVLSFHPCVQVPEHGLDKQALMFSPPFGNFTLMRYMASCNLGPPIKGFYQLSMVSENEGAFLFKLRLMDGYKAPLTMEFCTITMPFPRRRVVSFEGTPSIGTISFTDHSIEWKIIVSGRGITGKSVEAMFTGTVKFARLQTQKSFSSVRGAMIDEDSDDETENSSNMVNIEELLEEKMRKDLPPVELEEPFCWQAYDYAKASFKIMGTSLSGMSVDTKSIIIYPAVKAPIEFSTQVSSGEYILWNTLGKCPSAAMPKPKD
ncbi:AP-5 complex subunit mu [Silene latifolia]|uniref:AP-5 complex subunit mu n=1 Tax=Silene latifolia TaxID=37657 RepID=UPI003D778C75